MDGKELEKIYNSKLLFYGEKSYIITMLMLDTFGALVIFGIVAFFVYSIT